MRWMWMWVGFLGCGGGDSGSACLDEGLTCVGDKVCVVTSDGEAQQAACVDLPAECLGVECDGDEACDAALGGLCPPDIDFGGGSTCVLIEEDGEVTADHVQITCI